VDQLTFEEWRRVMRVNLDGLYLMCRASSDLMRKNGYGRIVNICSNSIFAGTPNMAHYVASKGGVLTFTRALATELGAHKITANCVAPGLTDTEGVQKTPHKDAFGFVEMLQAIKGVAGGHVPAVAFLASEEAHWITGQTLAVMPA
jgi:NAD(P)-dependent dehydrogenase (short-subunit alcohol dehydrogenase family)